MPAYARKKDLKHAAIADAFRRLGWTWVDCWQHAQYTPGFFDGMATRRGVVLGVEIKSGAAPLTPDEARFHASWEGPIVVVRTIDDVLVANSHDWSLSGLSGSGRVWPTQ